MRGRCENCGEFLFWKAIFSAMEKCCSCGAHLKKSKLDACLYLLPISVFPVKTWIADPLLSDIFVKNVVLTIYLFVSFLLVLLFRWWFGYRVKNYDLA